MFFYFKPKSIGESSTQVVKISTKTEIQLDNTLYIEEGAQACHRQRLSRGELILLGDPIFPAGEIHWEKFISANNRPDQDALFMNIRGHYYYFYITEGEVLCGSALSAIYPIYYTSRNGEKAISSSAHAIAERMPVATADRSNLLERLLFNYTFFNTSWWEEINLLESSRYLHIKGSDLDVSGSFDISNYFGAPEKQDRASLKALMPKFQEELALFFPDAPFGVSFTGGFDGRTIVAAARKAGKDFTTYSFGRPTSSDILFPLKQSASLGIDYNPIYLNEKYLNEAALACGYEFVESAGFNGNFGRPHYTYAARQLSKEVKYILTGNFGSELFRALHEPGVMISQSTVDVFHAQGSEWKDKLKRATSKWDSLYFAEALDQVIARMESYLAPTKGWDPNHRFYRFVFNDLFRKYFGPELIMQSKYFNNRTPYLSLPWIQTLNQTIWSGVHARLFEKKLNKRMKGQIFYSSFLRYADRQMYYQTTNKAYSGADVIERWRLPLLVSKVIIQKYIRQREDNENGSQDFFKKYHTRIANSWQQELMPNFLLKRQIQAQEQIQNGQELDQWIKLYSILHGWNAAVQMPIKMSK